MNSRKTPCLLLALCLLAALFIAGQPSDAEARNFTGNVAQDQKLFLSDGQWRESMRATWNRIHDDGISQAYNKLGKDSRNKLEGRRMDSVSVRDMKDVFAQAVCLMMDHQFAQGAVEEAEGELKSYLQRNVQLHEAGVARIYDPEAVFALVVSALHLSDAQVNRHMEKLFDIFTTLLAE
ncbi:MAG: hypothetical protein Q4F72_08785 [Desulfovibrionaceae bacterium]|nr:hypothetical protein [Desulfovibrionaceae bacterium]